MWSHAGFPLQEVRPLTGKERSKAYWRCKRDRQTCVFFSGVPLALLSSVFVYPVCSHPELVLLTSRVGARKQLEYVRMSCPDKKCQNQRACFLKQLARSSDVSLRKLEVVYSLSKFAFSFSHNST